MTWTQRPPQTKLGPSPSDEYHGCLDALIVTIRDLRESLDCITSCPIHGLADSSARSLLVADIEMAEERAAICAGLLFDRWIEERTPCDDCRDRVRTRFDVRPYTEDSKYFAVWHSTLNEVWDAPFKFRSDAEAMCVLRNAEPPDEHELQLLADKEAL